MTAQATGLRLADLAEAAEKIARTVRSLADAEAEREKDLAGFHSRSAARKAAMVLLDTTDYWLTRQEIADVSGCQPNAVTAVVNRLRGNGVIVQRRTVDGHAEFRVTSEEYV